MEDSLNTSPEKQVDSNIASESPKDLLQKSTTNTVLKKLSKFTMIWIFILCGFYGFLEVLFAYFTVSIGDDKSFLVLSVIIQLLLFGIIIFLIYKLRSKKLITIDKIILSGISIIGIILFLLLFVGPVASKLISNSSLVTSCNNDSDCISVPAGACGCGGGGRDKAVNRLYKLVAEQKFSLCIMVMSKDPSCTATPQCINHQCQLR